jgi:hypothetical protein
MRKVLSWLLILLLPVAGLFGGMWLVPTAKPLWQREFGYCISVLGFVEEGKTLLVAEESREGQQVLMGIDPRTGDEQFRQPLTGEQLQAKANQIREAALSDDGQYVVFPAEELNSYDLLIMLYDWKRNEVVKRFRVATEEFVHTVALKQGILTAITNKSVMQWKLDAPESVVEVTAFSNQTNGMVSNDSSLLLKVSIDNQPGGFVTSLKIKDLINKQVTSTRQFPTQILLIPQFDRERITTIEIVPSTMALPPSYIVRQYQFDQERQLQPTGQDRRLGVIGWLRGNKDAVVIVDSVNLQSWRWLLTKIVGKDITQVIPFLSSKTCQVHVYDRVTMEKLHVLNLPEAYKGRGFRFELHRQDAGLALWTERKIDYWQLQPPTRFLPLLGLLISSLLSLLLVIRRYRVTRHRLAKASTLMPASSGDSRLSAL